MAISAKDDHLAVELDGGVAIARVGADTSDSQLAFLAERHVKSKRVVSRATEAKVVFLALHLRHEVKAGVS